MTYDGTDPNDDGVVDADVDNQSVSTEDLHNVGLVAGNFDGATGGEKIQNALDTAHSRTGKQTVIVAGDGPDDLSGDSTEDNVDNGWLHTGLEIGPNTTLVLANCYLYLADGSDANILTNKDHINRTANISVVGFGKPRLDGNASNQTRTQDRHMIGIHMVRVDELSIEGIDLGPTNAWAICPEDCENWEIDNVRFSQNDATNNQDGINIGSPSTDGTMTNLTGESGDNLLGINAHLSQDFVQYKEADGKTNGDITDITVDGVHGRSADGTFMIRCLQGDGCKLQGVTIRNVHGKPGAYSHLFAMGRGSFPTDPPDASLFTDITIENCHRSGADGAFILVDTNIGSLTMRNCSIEGSFTVCFDTQANGWTAENVTIDGFTAEFGGGSFVGPVIDWEDDIDYIDARNIHITQCKKFLTGGGTIGDGVIKDVTVETCDGTGSVGNVIQDGGTKNIEVTDWDVDRANVTGQMYATLPTGLKFGGGMPNVQGGAEDVPPHVLGSRVRAHPNWDPDGDGNGEVVESDGTAWQEVVDLPNWT